MLIFFQQVYKFATCHVQSTVLGPKNAKVIGLRPHLLFGGMGAGKIEVLRVRCECPVSQILQLPYTNSTVHTRKNEKKKVTNK